MIFCGINFKSFGAWVSSNGWEACLRVMLVDGWGWLRVRGAGLGLLSDVGKGATDSVAQAVCWRITKTSLYGAVYIANHGKTSKPWGQINEFNCLSDQEHNGLFDHFVSEGQKVTKLDCFQVPKGGMRQMVAFLYKIGPCWSFLDYF